ncbi:hypothetical protein [uncultured Paludibaculum sp.]|uniref:hypothetical protein n=1 Tax=uncultured Paludibaculum sp. TaxID=1765020 RepID=UPI002AAB2974|nr:hypothetical protein [uncultured Paludibaculum sp.]
MKSWLEETHGPTFELIRHFLTRYFDSDIVTTPGQWITVFVGGFAVFLSAFLLVSQSLLHKYNQLAVQAAAQVYGDAVRADELWLVTAAMGVIGLLTAVNWQSLLPTAHDYFALGSLPLRAWRVFVAKFVALFLLVTTATASVNLLPSLAFPVTVRSSLIANGSVFSHIGAHAISASLGSYFFFFALLGLQALLLNMLPRRLFAYVTAIVQAAAITAMLALIILSASIEPSVLDYVLRDGLRQWIPPVWFLGLYETLLGHSTPVFQELTGYALTGVSISCLAATALYALSYSRHNALLLAGTGVQVKWGALASRLLDRAIPNPREQAVFVMMLQVLTRSAQHRMILMAYVGFVVAMIASGVFGTAQWFGSEWARLSSFLYGHLVALIFLFIGMRHLFSLPVALSANWIFQITEREGRRDWVRAVDRFMVIFVIGGIVILPMPLEFAIIGRAALREVALAFVGGVFLYGTMFFDVEKLPFTCSYLPGKMPPWAMVVIFIGIISLLPFVCGLLTAALSNSGALFVLLSLLIVLSISVHRSRQATLGALALKYEEAPDPAVLSLHLPGK